MTTEKIHLTQFSRGAGCGCKVAPDVLQCMLQTMNQNAWPNLVVGNDTKDDAAVLDLGNGHLLISTTDFFMPIVDDAFDFGRIAATNALSDVYAMGGKPVLALAILGWPVDKLPAELAAAVLKGAQRVCDNAGLPLAGGHTVDSAEPFFGLSVNGLVEKTKLKRNNTAKHNNLLYLTKPIGTGIVTTAAKRGLANESQTQKIIDVMTTVNSAGAVFAEKDYVHAMTDVTGFGLVGHLLEMCLGSDLSAEIDYNAVPLLDDARAFVKQFVYPDNTMRIWKSLEADVAGINGESLLTLCDPQTSGGLLVAVDDKMQSAFETLMKEIGLVEHAKPIGRMVANNNNERRIRITY